MEVHPDHRRRGAGGALLAAAEQVAADDRRQVVFGDEEVRTDGTGNAPFARSHGYSMVLENLRRELTVPLDPISAERLQATAAPHAADYEIVVFGHPWPEEWLEDRVVFGRRMSTDPPAGGFALTEERWDAARVRGLERLVEGMGREALVGAAVERSTGRPVAFTELTVSRTVPEVAYQWDTLVLPEHRGHRLGMLVKLANLRRLAERSPGTSTIVTWNARANDPMIAVNDALGCQVVSVGYTWQKRL